MYLKMVDPPVYRSVVLTVRGTQTLVSFAPRRSSHQVVPELPTATSHDVRRALRGAAAAGIRTPGLLLRMRHLRGAPEAPAARGPSGNV